MNSMPFFVFLILVSLNGCRYFTRTEKVPVARVGDDVLYLSDIQSILPKNNAPEDSFLLAGNYIDQWIRNRLLIKKAQENLAISQRDLARELEEYRNSLLIYRYQEELMQEKMDTSVTDQQIIAYFEEKKENFILNNDIIKFIYVKFPLSKPKSKLLLKYFNNFSDDILDKIQEFCDRYASSCNFSLEHWTDAKTAFQGLPEIPDDLHAFLVSQALWKTKDDSCDHFLFIYNYQLAGNVTPVELVKENIRKMIINKRKTAFIRKLEDDVYADGVLNNKFTIYEEN